jgi:hypothetical protein
MLNFDIYNWYALTYVEIASNDNERPIHLFEFLLSNLTKFMHLMPVFFFIYKFCGYDRHNVAKISNKLQYMINGETTILVFKYTSRYHFDLQFAEKHKIMLDSSIR